ncbi:MAG: hypothetical protein ACJAVI_003910 [Candidatus Azotimanducaceae bacterium]|jgi:hypothetical protein
MSWEQLAEMDAFGTSRFQNLCCRGVAKFIPDVMFEEKGEDEKYFVADIPINNIKVYVYLDRAEIVSSGLEIRFERADSETPEDLSLKLIRELSNAF